MKKVLVGIIGFILGGASGYSIGYYVSKKKFMKKADEEIKSVKETLTSYYNNKIEELGSNPPKKVVKKKTTKEKESPVVEESDETVGINKNGYSNYSAPYRASADKDASNKKEEKKILVDEGPYLITEEEFTHSDYDTKTLLYYADNVLTDDDLNMITDEYDTIGGEALNILQQHKYNNPEDVYVRNDKYKIDYEILLDERSYYTLSPNRTRYLGKSSREEDD